MVEAEGIVILLSSTLILAYISDLFYNRTKIPDIIWLLFFGIMLGPVLNVFEKSYFLSFSDLMSILALGIILFDAGYNIDYKSLIKVMGKSLLLAVASFVSILVIVGSVLRIFMYSQFTLIDSLLLSSMISGTSTIAVISILNNMKKLDINLSNSYTLLVMESVVSDPICIVAAITLIKIKMLANMSVTESFLNIFNAFITSAIIGLLGGLLWAFILNKLNNKKYSYITTLAVMFPLYLLAEQLSGSGGGPITALLFGLGMNNCNNVWNRLGIKEPNCVDLNQIRVFHEEITHFIKSFFFVYVGLIVNINLDMIIIGIIVSGFILVIRYVIVDGLSKIVKFELEEIILSRIIFSQGLPALVMSQLPRIFDKNQTFFKNPEIFVSICVPVVLITVMYNAILGPMLVKNQFKQNGISSENKEGL
ncbi:cation:proton antiporter [Candidatus Bathyarchaeota archaeon]|nr:cation:proton antiporter [Candidatus Bathyarchaeota archaeon]